MASSLCQLTNNLESDQFIHVKRWLINEEREKSLLKNAKLTDHLNDHLNTAKRKYIDDENDIFSSSEDESDDDAILKYLDETSNESQVKYLKTSHNKVQKYNKQGLKVYDAFEDIDYTSDEDFEEGYINYENEYDEAELNFTNTKEPNYLQTKTPSDYRNHLHKDPILTKDEQIIFEKI